MNGLSDGVVTQEYVTGGLEVLVNKNLLFRMVPLKDRLNVLHILSELGDKGWDVCCDCRSVKKIRGQTQSLSKNDMSR